MTNRETPQTVAGQELLHDLNFDPHQRQRLKGSIVAIERESARSNLESLIREESDSPHPLEDPDPNAAYNWAMTKQPRHEYVYGCGNCGETITALIPCEGAADYNKLRTVETIVDEVIPTSPYYQILDAINRIAEIVRTER